MKMFVLKHVGRELSHPAELQNAVLMHREGLTLSSLNFP